MGYFLVIRDRHGLTQVVLESTEELNNAEILESVPLESVISVSGTVRERVDGQHNEKMATGHIELHADALRILNCSTPKLPFEVHEKKKVKETLRMEYRYLDLRHSILQRNLQVRSDFCFKAREFLCKNNGFVDVETPALFRKTPGGAREFIVPTHSPGKFYTLPQSPQQFKQLLMVGGIDRYMQIAKCFRDEGAKADRQPEFTQIDLEMSFVKQEQIQELTEQLLKHCWPESLPAIKTPFPRMKYGDAMKRYGSDKPDTRFKMKASTLSLIKLLHQIYVIPIILAIKFRCRPAIVCAKGERFARRRARHDRRGYRKTLCPWRLLALFPSSSADGSWQGSLADQLGEDCVSQVTQYMWLEPGDLLVIAAGEHIPTCSLLGKLRLSIADEMESKGHNVRGDDNRMNFLWVVDFPLFLPKEDGSEGLESAHHPFTAPHPDDLELVHKQPENARSQHYDLVLNGQEVGGGSIRIHDSNIQSYILQCVLKVDSEPLSHLLEALKYGCPPHGGIALGLDRLMAIMMGSKSIREVIAFPKNSEGKDAMAQAPSAVPQEDLDYYNVQCKQPPKTAS
ncbi:hypothetical protein CAPTEDRAFT_155791 [Capitella teleta]|uniref:Aminoacyl-transfer RNA synthetases class-II family profile domain-containing protein n=1 Tax=Capitella teleta TaxID=283909 RepID=R7V6M9_CAPTE|nr:hypothetical protein CAPTEDRAFT_155791 [Capitella teleta]|eukprot:ELU14533.1 hypothetical protein CAPTEDRAFT_155791 [Capitella teleta]